MLPLEHNDLFVKLGIKPPKGKYKNNKQAFYFMVHQVQERQCWLEQ